MAKRSIDIKKLAEVGAASRISELKAELESLYRHFPELRSGRTAASRKASRQVKERRGKKRSTMSAAQKKAVSVRMKKYWAARRAPGSSK